MFIASKNRPGKRNGIKREKPKKKKKKNREKWKYKCKAVFSVPKWRVNSQGHFSHKSWKLSTAEFSDIIVRTIKI